MLLQALLIACANYVKILVLLFILREDQDLDENARESKWFDYFVSSGGKTIARSGLTTITIRSSANPFSSGAASRLMYFCEAALIKWKSGSASMRTTVPRISRAR